MGWKICVVDWKGGLVRLEGAVMRLVMRLVLMGWMLGWMAWERGSVGY